MRGLDHVTGNNKKGPVVRRGLSAFSTGLCSSVAGSIAMDPTPDPLPDVNHLTSARQVMGVSLDTCLKCYFDALDQPSR